MFSLGNSGKLLLSAIRPAPQSWPIKFRPGRDIKELGTSCGRKDSVEQMSGLSAVDGFAVILMLNRWFCHSVLVLLLTLP